jgi:hypothetical protein
MRDRNVESILVTTSDGRLVGTLYRTDAERQLAQEEEEIGEDEGSCVCR